MNTTAKLKAVPIRTEEELQSIRADWKKLWLQDCHATPFQSPEWLLPWWGHYNDGGALHAWGFWNESELVGLAPLYIHTDPATRLRRLFLLGTGNSDYLGVLTTPPHAAECRHQIAKQLAETKESWDVCELHQLRSGLPLIAELRAVFGDRVQVTPDEACPAIAGPLPKTRLRTRAREARAELESLRPIRFELADATSLETTFAAFSRLHRLRWDAKHISGAFKADRDQAFYKAVADGFHASGLLRLHALRLSDEIVAVLYTFQHQRRKYLYQSGFHPAYADLGIGNILIAQALEASEQEGCRSFDFLRGQEPYKYRWGARDQLTFQIKVS